MKAICSDEALLNKFWDFCVRQLCREYSFSVKAFYTLDRELTLKERITKAQIKKEATYMSNAYWERCLMSDNYLEWRESDTARVVRWGDYKKKYKGTCSNKLIQSDILTDLELYRDLKMIARLDKLKAINKEQNYLDKETIQHLEKRRSEIKKEYFIQARLLFHRNRSKLYRAKKRLKEMIKSDTLVLFMTLTNSDKYFERSNYQSRLLYAKRLLKKYACDYMLNTDYGKENGREHFHSVACFRSKNDYKAFCEAYRTHTESAIYNRHFGKTNRDCIKGARYISCLTLEKLAFHSVKDTTKHSRLIYCSNPDFNKRGRLMA